MNVYFIVIISVICFFAFLSFLLKVIREYQARKMYEFILFQFMKDCKVDPESLKELIKSMDNTKWNNYISRKENGK